MPRVNKKRFISAVLLLLLAAAAGYLFLSRRTFYAELVVEKVGDALGQSGYKLGADSVSGNPITGVSCGGVTISSGGVLVAAADRMEISLALPTLLSGNPKLARMDITGLSADLDTVRAHMPPSDPSRKSGPPPIERLAILKSTLRTPWGIARFDDLSAAIGEAGYDASMKGSLDGRKISLNAKISSTDGPLRLEDFSAEIAGAEIRARGEISPSLGLSCEVRGLEMDSLYEILPEARASTMSGAYGGKFIISGAPGGGPEVSGSLSSKSGGIWILPFEDMDLSLRYSGGKLDLDGISSRMFGGEVRGSAALAFGRGAKPEIWLKLSAESLDTRTMTDALPWMKNFAGVIDAASCDIRGPLNELGGTAQIRAKTFKAADFDVSGASIAMGVSGGKTLSLSFDGTSYGSPLAGEATVTLAPELNISAHVELSRLSLDDLSKKYPEIKRSGARGETAVSLGISGPPAALVISGSASSQEIQLGEEHSFSGAKADFEFSDGALAIKNAAARWRGATITAEGRSNFLRTGPSLDFKGRITGLELASLGDMLPPVRENGAAGTISGSWALGGTANGPALSLDISAPRLGASGGALLRNVKASAGYISSVITISNITGEMGSAAMAAAGHISLASGERPLEYDIKGSFKHLDPGDIAKIAGVSADISGDLDGDARAWKTGRDPEYRVFFRPSSLRYSNVLDVSAFRGLITLSGGELRLDNLKTDLNMGYIGLNGKIGNVMGGNMREMPVDIKASVASADIGRISRLFNPMSHGFQGIVNGSADIRGNLAAPSFTADARLSSVRAFGLFLPVIWLDGFHGDLSKADFPSVRALVGRGTIDASGSIAVKSGDWRGEVKAAGRSVDIRSLMFSLNGDARRAITGSLDFDFEGSGGLDSFSGRGTAKIPSLSVRGVTLTDVRAPFLITDGFVLVEESSAKAYGGTVSAQAAKDLNLSNWGGRLEVASADTASAFRDIMPDSEGTITGVTNLMMRFAGDTRRTSMQDGSGNIEITDGEISGFEGAKAVSKLVRGKPLRFRSASFSFSIDGKTVYILPGSRVSAPSGDPIFKYVMADGSVTMEGETRMSCVGNVNIRALNAFAAGLQGALTSAMEGGATTDDLLQNFLGSAITGFSRNEFRDVSLKVAGKPGEMKFSNVTVANPVRRDTMPEGLAEPEGAREKDMERVNIRIEFPVGPGGKGSSGDDIGGQVGGQVLDQAIKGLLNF